MIWHQNSENLMKLQINNDNIFGNSNHLYRETYMIIFNLEICKTAGTFSKDHQLSQTRTGTTPSLLKINDFLTLLTSLRRE